jgi:hypothetical protein
MSFLKDIFREFEFAFCVSEIVPMFINSCVKIPVGSYYIKFVAFGACQFINITFKILNTYRTKILIVRTTDFIQQRQLKPLIIHIRKITVSILGVLSLEVWEL